MKISSHLGKIILKVSMIAVFFNILIMNNDALGQNVAITDNDSYIAESSAMLDVMSTSKGMLVPRLTTLQRNGITNPAQGLMVYDIDLNSFMYYNGSVWIAIPQLVSSAGSGDALFAVVNQLGDTVFAVYHDGVTIFVDPDAKGRVGGFAVSGRTPTKLGEKVEYFRVTPDSTRIYVNDSIGAKGRVGGFAVSGRTPTKGGIKEYFTINKDSTRIYIDSSSAKSRVGGFAVSGRTPTKDGNVQKFMNITKDNYLIGHESGKSITSGLYNSFLGYQTGIENTSGTSNSFMGYQAGYGNTQGTGNLFLGYQSGYSNTLGSYNSFLGYKAGYSNTQGKANTFLGSYTGEINSTGNSNTLIGYRTGSSNTDGFGNVFIGDSTGFLNSSGDNNVFIGSKSGYSNSIGDYNTFLGFHSGISNTKGRYNVLLGYEAGFSNDSSFNTFVGYQVGRANTTGSNNVFMGYRAGYNNTVSSNNVSIGFEAGFSNSTRGDNISIGYYAGWANDSYSCVFIGTQAGVNAINGRAKIMIGPQAGLNATNAPYSIFIGGSAGTEFSSGDENIFIGADAGKYKRVGSHNIQIGSGAGAQGWDISNYTSSGDNVIIGYRAAAWYGIGSNNVIIGNQASKFAQNTSQSVYIGPYAGYNAKGTGNIFIGDSAGYFEESSNKLYISNTDDYSTGALIYGEFDNKLLRINGKLLAGFYPNGVGNINAYAIEIGGPAPNATNSEATIFLHHHASVAHQLRYTAGTLYLEAAGNGYGSTLTPTFQVNGPIYAAVLGGSVGIGTTTPGAYKLYVNGGDLMVNRGDGLGGNIKMAGHSFVGSADWGNLTLGAGSNGGNASLFLNTENTIRMTILGNGKVGIGTTIPIEMLQVGLESSGPTARKAIKFGSGGYGAPAGYQTNSNGDKLIFYNADSFDGRIGIGSISDMWFKASGSSVNTGRFIWYIGSTPTEIMRIEANGYVGIGTTSPDKKLHVVGDARVTGSIFYGTSTTTYNKPDYVFSTDYNKYLDPISVEKFVKENGHLPWLTAAKDETDGINLTRMQFETVETVENLQLQIIEIKKDYQQQIQHLEEQNAQFKSELEAIKAVLQDKR